jgi:hypothetical protein
MAGVSANRFDHRLRVAWGRFSARTGHPLIKRSAAGLACAQALELAPIAVDPLAADRPRPGGELLRSRCDDGTMRFGEWTTACGERNCQRIRRDGKPDEIVSAEVDPMQPATSLPGSADPGARRALHRAAIICVASGLLWAALTLVSAYGCVIDAALGGGGDYGSSLTDWLLLLPALALCALGIGLWRRSAMAVPLMPLPLVLSALLGVVGAATPKASAVSMCAFWLGPRGLHGLPALFPFLFAVGVPALGAVTLRRFDPDAWRRGTEAGAGMMRRGAARACTARALAGVLGLAAITGVGMLLHGLTRPVPPAETVPFKALGTLTTTTRWDLVARLAILRVEHSRFGESPTPLARVLEQRIGPVQWAAGNADTWVCKPACNSDQESGVTGVQN